MIVALRMTGRQYGALRAHLFPGDGMEAVSVGVCGRHRGIRQRSTSISCPTYDRAGNARCMRMVP